MRDLELRLRARTAERKRAAWSALPADVQQLVRDFVRVFGCDVEIWVGGERRWP